MDLTRSLPTKLPAKLSTGLPTDQPLRFGTDLALCRGSRHIRVLSLPAKCGRKILLDWWEDSFGDAGLVVWPPPGEGSGAHHIGPSTN